MKPMISLDPSLSIGLHCPVCKVDLVMMERKNVEIDYCPKCRGVWLDRGELNKIIEKSMSQQHQQHGQPMSSPPSGPSYGYEQHGHHGGCGKHGYRRKSWLEKLFD